MAAVNKQTKTQQNTHKQTDEGDFHYMKERTSMMKAQILPKTPRELRSNFKMMRRALKLVDFDSKIY